MNSSDTKRRLFILLVSAINLGVQTILCGYVWYKYYNPIIRIPFWTKGHWYILTLFCLVLIFFTHIYGGFKIGYLKKWDSMFSQIFATLCANTVFYAEIALLAYYFPTPLPLIVITLINITFVIFWLQISTNLYSRLFSPHEIILICGAGREAEAKKKLSERPDKFHVIETIVSDHENLLIKNKILKNNAKAVVFWGVPSSQRSDLIKFCYEMHIRIYAVPGIQDILLSGAEVMHFFDTPLLLIRSTPLSIDQQLVKRIADIILAFFVLIIASPIMLITAICIKLYDGGPILYKQIRCTINAKQFNIYKFRSMRTDAEKNGIPQLASKNDNRITPVGKLIRKTRIDELPQLFNVIRGDMSFVGPRPERPEIISKYIEELPEFSYRMHVKAGLTGYAQIYGKYNTEAYDKLKLDLYYVEHYSLWLDLKLLILTTKIIFSPESTEGVDNAC